MISTSNSNYRSDIDGLRALAVISVVLYHAFPELLPGGFIGVDVFFVISGFLITKIIATANEKKKFSYSDFYLRRVRRIFPALYLVLLTTAAVACFILLPDELEQFGKHLLGAVFFASNYILRKEAGYFDAASESKPLLHLWSLAVEEQYYIFFPLILITILKLRLKPLTALLALVLSSFALNVGLVGRHPASTFYFPATRMWEIMIGGVLAYLPLDTKRARLTTPNTISALGMIAFIVSVVFINQKVVFPGWAAAIPVLSAALFIGAGKDAYLNRTLFSFGWVTAIGRMSYPLYLWHWPLLSLLFVTQLNSPSATLRLVAVVISILLAYLTHRCIEIPGGRLSNKKIISILSVSVGISGVTGGLYYFGRGLPWRYDILNKTHLKAQMQELVWGENLIGSNECKKKYPANQFCNIGNIEKPADVALIGDSHANHFFWGLSEHYQSKGKNLVNLGRGGCPPFYKMDGTAQAGVNYNCTDSFDEIFDFVIRSSSIRTVLLAFHHDAYMGPEVRYLDKLGEITGPDNFVNEQRAFIRTVRALKSAGKRVILIYDLPDLKLKNIRNFVNLRPLDLRLKSTNEGTNFFINNFQKYDSLVRETRRVTQLEIFFPDRFLEGNFPIDKDGRLSYRDVTHLSLNGSRIVGKHFDLD